MLSPMFKRLFYGFLALVVVAFGGGAGYYLIGGGRWPFGDCLYMTVITVTTVGVSLVALVLSFLGPGIASLR